MSERSYRVTVLVSALVWFLLGMHSPVLHQFTHHNRTPDTTVLVVIAVLAILGIVCVLALWRAPRFGGGAGPHE
jgi:cytochrome c oxidase assembly factor CtaG